MNYSDLDGKITLEQNESINKIRDHLVGLISEVENYHNKHEKLPSFVDSMLEDLLRELAYKVELNKMINKNDKWRVNI